MTQAQVEQIIRTELADCEPQQRETFERYRVSLRRAPIMRYGRSEYVFIVAQRGNEVMYYEDVEGGFNFSPLGQDGQVLQHWCDQDELKFALWHWMGHPKQNRAGPAEPIK